MRKNIIIMLVLAMLTSGCCRIILELEHSGEVRNPPSRIYAGTKIAVFLPYYAANAATFVRHPGFDDYAAVCVLFPLALCNIPLDIAMDTVILPFDLLVNGICLASPPLDYYVYYNKMPELRKKLENGADPNAISPWFRKNVPLIQTAFQQGNEEIFALLLEHGAIVPIGVFTSVKPDWKHIRMLKAAFSRGKAIDALASPEAEFIISDLIDEYLHTPEKASSDDMALAELLVMLLDNGFLPGGWNSRVGKWHEGTPLDVVIQNHAMETEAKDRLVKAMIGHGAKTEKSKINDISEK